MLSRTPLLIGLIWALLPALALAQNSAPANLPAPVLKALNQGKVPLHGLSVLVLPLPTTPGPALAPRLAHREHESVHPASVMKLFTTFAGLQLLGSDFTWRNRIYTDGTVQGGVLQGNLIVRGSGDPKLVVERLQDLVGQIMAQGVREVRGNIVLDRSVFDVTPRQVGFDDEPLRPYNASPDGLLLNFKSVVYTFSPDPASGRAKVHSEPPLADFSVTADVPLRSGPCQDWRSELKADFSQPQQTRFSGSYASGCGERTWPVAFPRPDDFAPRVFQALWLQAGGKLSGQTVYGNTPAKATLLLEARSLPLTDVVADINKFSNNVMAQQLFLTLSSELGSPGRFEASRLRLDQWWRQQFPGLPAPVLENGSGLSRSERSTARSLSALLHKAHESELSQVFRQSLAIAGVDGTMARLKDRQPQAGAIGKAWLKTGTLRDVASIAGYVQGDSGRLYTLVAVLHHPNAQMARPALDALLEWTVRDSAATTPPATRKP
jgi:D-alanyl-D-alanine carboxypeptidase/D-alanyl-D-alanine-endopeptidase (penicillin-binding protein 4)